MTATASSAGGLARSCFPSRSGSISPLPAAASICWPIRTTGPAAAWPGRPSFPRTVKLAPSSCWTWAPAKSAPWLSPTPSRTSPPPRRGPSWLVAGMAGFISWMRISWPRASAPRARSSAARAWCASAGMENGFWWLRPTARSVCWIRPAARPGTQTSISWSSLSSSHGRPTPGPCRLGQAYGSFPAAGWRATTAASASSKRRTA